MKAQPGTLAVPSKGAEVMAPSVLLLQLNVLQREGAGEGGGAGARQAPLAEAPAEQQAAAPQLLPSQQQVRLEA